MTATLGPRSPGVKSGLGLKPCRPGISQRTAGDLPIAGCWEGRDAIIDDFLATAQSYYAPGSVSIEVTAMVAEADQVVLQWTSRARVDAGYSQPSEAETSTAVSSIRSTTGERW